MNEEGTHLRPERRLREGVVCVVDDDWDDGADGEYGRGILDVDGLLGNPLPSLRAVCLNKGYLDRERRRRDQARRGKDALHALFKDKFGGNGDCEQRPTAAP